MAKEDRKRHVCYKEKNFTIKDIKISLYWMYLVNSKDRVETYILGVKYHIINMATSGGRAHFNYTRAVNTVAIFDLRHTLRNTDQKLYLILILECLP